MIFEQQRLRSDTYACICTYHKEQCLTNVGNVLKAAGTSWDKVVKVNIYLKDMGNFAAMNKVYEKVRLIFGCAASCIVMLVYID